MWSHGIRNSAASELHMPMHTHTYMPLDNTGGANVGVGVGDGSAANGRTSSALFANTALKRLAVRNRWSAKRLQLMSRLLTGMDQAQVGVIHVVPHSAVCWVGG